MRIFILGLIATAIINPACAAEPDNLILPPGFHATIVADGLGPFVRHLAFRNKESLYVSTERQTKDAANEGILALHLNANGVADRVEHFSEVDNGTGIAFHDGALYAASANTVYRFRFSGGDLVPTSPPIEIVRNVPFRSPIVFDGNGRLYLAVGGGSNFCTPANSTEGIGPVSRLPPDYKPVGIKPCPTLTGRAGVWRFDASKADLDFIADGEHFATGIRDINALAWSRNANSLYGVMYGRDGTNKFWPMLVSPAEDANISDEMFRISRGANMGWPYTYYDAVRHVRLQSPEYGGDGKTAIASKEYSVPVVAFPAHVAPQAMVFYEGVNFPKHYRGGAFIALHGAGGDQPEGHDSGYNVVFVPFGKSGKAGAPEVFVDGFAGSEKTDRNGTRARYRPMGLAISPDGSLFVAESQKGRIWRISYGAN
jgi:glucose/arabinose dehydrogenase